MAIKDEISRLQQAKQDFKTKLIEKGVTVSDDELISDYPPKLDEIKGGTNTTDATATANEIRKGFTAYIASGKVEGAIEDYDGAFEILVVLPEEPDVPEEPEEPEEPDVPKEPYVSVLDFNPSVSPDGCCSAVYDNKIYHIGSSSQTRNINIIDPINKVKTSKTSVFSSGHGYGCATEYNGKIYIFGNSYMPYSGQKTIKVYDPISETSTIMTATLNKGLAIGMCCVCNDKIYISNSESSYVECYDPQTDTISVTTINIKGCGLCECNNLLYLIGGTSSSDKYCIRVYDTTTGTITTPHDGNIAFYANYLICVVVNSNIYILKGKNIYLYNVASNTLTTLDITLEKEITNVYGYIKNKLYLVSGGNICVVHNLS